MSKTNDLSKFPTETDYVGYNDSKRMPSRSKQQPFAIKPHNQSGSLESIKKDNESNSTNLTS
jgi:hypothetical protein